MGWTIAAVSACTALMVWLFWRLWKSVERAERDPRYLRRRMLFFGMIYVAAALFGIEQVATGRKPLGTLIGLPIALGFAWFWLRSASQVKVPPAKPQQVK
jgi:hypothetical protein